MSKFSEAEKLWKQESENSAKRDYSFDTVSGEKVDTLYYPEGDDDFIKKFNFPGQFPYTRGIHPNLYRGKLWTMRQFAGFGSPDETNKRFKFLDSGSIEFTISVPPLKVSITLPDCTVSNVE